MKFVSSYLLSYILYVSKNLHCLSPRLTTQVLCCPSMSTEFEKPLSSDAAKSVEDSWSVNHVSGDLFSCPVDEALAHCISEDCHMGAGIAVLFKRKFGGVEGLKKQKKLPGQCAVLKIGRRYVYYLITKRKYSDKPTYDSLRQSLEDMRSHCVENGVTRISMPRIGCGLDRLKWERVSEILEQIFKPIDISITVYTLPKKPETTTVKRKRC